LGLTEREVESGALEGPAPVVDRRLHLRRSLGPEVEVVEAPRVLLERPGAGEHLLAREMLVIARRVRHVLPLPGLVAATEDDRRRDAGELARDLELAALQRVVVDAHAEICERLPERRHTPSI